MTDQVWYAAYGSNLNRQRFLCYLRGGTPDLGRRKHEGSKDRRSPAEDRILTIPHRLYFALPEGASRTENWGRGGVAFIDPRSDPTARTVCRIWRISREQYRDVRVQEGLVWYDNEIELGQADGIPIFTVSHACRLGRVVAPSRAYLKTIAVGLRETAGLSSKKIAEYLLDKVGIKGRIPRSEIEEILADLK